MRTLIRTRARMLVAGVGLFFLAGCWSTPSAPPQQRPYPNSNIPKTNVNSPATGNAYGRPGQPNGTSTSGLNNDGMVSRGQPVNRVSGAPGDGGRVNITSAPTGAAAGPLGPPSGDAGTGLPIATNAGAPRRIEPAGYSTNAPKPLPDLDPVPSGQNQVRELPPVKPITLQDDPSIQDAYRKRSWQKKSPPEMPADSSLPMPATIPMLRGVEPLTPPGSLQPPPG